MHAVKNVKKETFTGLLRNPSSTREPQKPRTQHPAPYTRVSHLEEACFHPMLTLHRIADLSFQNIMTSLSSPG